MKVEGYNFLFYMYMCKYKLEFLHLSAIYTPSKVLKETINDILLEVTELVSAHLASSNMSDDQLSTALDLWYSKLSATAQILPGLNINGRSEDLIIDEDRVAYF